MPEPTLLELTNIPSDAALGSAGLTDYVPTSMRAVNQQMFEAAKFKAQMDWQKYTQFLQNFKDFTKDADAINDIETAAPDKPYLKKQMADIMATIAANPKSALGGNGMADLQAKLQKLKADAVQSKQDNAFDLYHRQFLDRVPDMKTDENKGKVESFLTKQKLGQRQPYMLDAANDFDAQAMATAVKKGSTTDFSEPTLVGKDGEAGEGYIKTETGTELNPKAFLAQWDLGLEQPKLKSAIQKRYDSQPDEIKKAYTKEQWYHQLGVDHLNSIVPEGSYDKTDKGNYRFDKKSSLVPDQNYLKAQALAEQKREREQATALGWYNAHTARQNADKEKDVKEPEVIEQPAIMLGNHIDRLKKDFATGKYNNGIRVQAAGVDEKTKLALGLKDDERVIYMPDGSYDIYDAKGEKRTTGTIDNLVQGFIEAVKVTDTNADPDKNKDGTMAVGFQQKSEAALKKLFGTTSGKKIWESKILGKTTQQTSGGSHPDIKQNGEIYRWNEKTQKYE